MFLKHPFEICYTFSIVPIQFYAKQKKCKLHILNFGKTLFNHTKQFNHLNTLSGALLIVKFGAVRWLGYAPAIDCKAGCDAGKSADRSRIHQGHECPLFNHHFLGRGLSLPASSFLSIGAATPLPQRNLRLFCSHFCLVALLDVESESIPSIPLGMKNDTRITIYSD